MSSAPTAARTASTARWRWRPARCCAGTSPISPTRCPPIPSARIRRGAIPRRSCRWTPSAPWSPTCSANGSRRATTSARRSRSPRRTSTCRRCTRRSPRGRLVPDGRVLLANGSAVVTKAAIEPVWWLPGVARRFGCQRGRPAARAVRGNGRHVSRARHARRPRRVPAADRRPDGVRLRQSARPRQSRGHAHRARARRVQRLGRVRLRHLHLPALSHARDRGVHPRRAGRRRGPRRLLPQGGPCAGRGDQVPRLQRAQAAGRAATPPATISCAPSAWRACRTCASRS